MCMKTWRKSVDVRRTGLVGSGYQYRESRKAPASWAALDGINMPDALLGDDQQRT